MGAFTVITEPTAEPVSIKETKEALRILHDDEDDRVVKLIKAAREFAESYCGIYIMPTVVELTLDRFPAVEFGLSTWPIESVDSIKYDDTSSPSAEVTLVVNVDYYADTTTEGGRVTTIKGWPSLAVKPNPIRIRMTAGYTTAEKVPEQIKDGIKAYAAYLYDQDPQLKQSAKNILWPQRIL